MKSFKLRNDIIYAVDTKGVFVVDRAGNIHLLIDYPEAAVWSVLINNYGVKKSTRMISAILDRDEADAGIFIRHCLRKWQQLNLID
jgi:hypothetical protein